MKREIILSSIMVLICFAISVTIQCDREPQLSRADSNSDKVLNFQLDSFSYGSFDIEILSKRDVKKAVDKAIASDIGMPRSSVESKMGLSIATTDTVKLTQKTESIYIYKDRWLDAKVNLYDSTMTYRARDSLSQYIERIYKHKFLFWKWGTKGYRVHIINHNPNSKIEYADYIRVGE